jgi:hydrogenase maturation protein HypF
MTELVVKLPEVLPPVLATGAWFKNTVCAVSGNVALISASVGDLRDAEACRAHERHARELLGGMAQPPVAIAHDLHPDFHSSRFAAELAGELGVPLIGVQHHHAHIAAVCAEHGMAGPVLGLALDGVGLGTDGAAWGGELLRVEGRAFQRLGHLRPLPMPGGDRAALEPWRMAAAVLHELGRGGEIKQRFADEPAAATVATMLQRDLNCPRTSSLGRVFDAAAALLGVCLHPVHDAQAPMALEQAATRHIAVHGWPEVDASHWSISADGQLDLRPLLAKLAQESDAERGAARFHSTLVAALADWVGRASHQTDITTTLACGGGCFFNTLLMRGMNERLAGSGLTRLFPQALPPGDSSIALGQAWVACHTVNR